MNGLHEEGMNDEMGIFGSIMDDVENDIQMLSGYDLELDPEGFDDE